jgi:hypothetical protein
VVTEGEVAGTISIGRKYYAFKWNHEEGLAIVFESDGEPVRGINELGQIIGNDGSDRNRLNSTFLQSPHGGYLWHSNGNIESLGRTLNRDFHVNGINDLCQTEISRLHSKK